MDTEKLIRAVLSKICQDHFKTDYQILLKQMGESDDNFDHGLRFFVSKLKLTTNYRRLGRASDCLQVIYSFYRYGHPINTVILQDYLANIS